MKALAASDLAYTFHDIRDDTPTVDDLTKWVGVVGEKKILNTRSTTWRGLADDERAYAGAGELAALLHAHPTLIKRPLIVSNKGVFTGWDETIHSTLA